MEIFRSETLKFENHKKKTMQDVDVVLSELIQLGQKKLQQTGKPYYGNGFYDCPRFLSRLGIAVSDLDKLNIIHVAGTKGKGSTCKFTESILRQAGLRTGLLISPYVVTVKEQILINGDTLPDHTFVEYFFNVYEKLVHNDHLDLPTHYVLVVCMAFYVFLNHQQLDAVILEVGIGGIFCATNVVRQPVVTVITSLALDHQDLLGNTLTEIAKAKAGIMKPDVPCVTVHNQPNEAMNTLKTHAKDVAKCKLNIAPPLKELEDVRLGIDGSISKLNAGLAVEVANIYLARTYPAIIGVKMSILEQSWCLEGLRSCVHVGRFQKIYRSDKLTLYLDGAHTKESLGLALSWFNESTKASPKEGQDGLRVVVLYMCGNREASNHLESLIASKINGDIDKVIFCSPALYKKNGVSFEYHGSVVASKVREDGEVERCRKLQDSWQQLTHGSEELQTITEVADSVQETLRQLDNEASSGTKVDVLVTGSLSLVGAWLSCLDSAKLY